METVAEILRGRREALGLTLQALADEIGATKGYLSMIENRRVANPPSRKLLLALERALGIGDGELQRAADWENTPPDVRQKLEAATEQAARAEALARLLKEVAGKGKGGPRDLDKLMASGEFKQRLRVALNPGKAPPSVEPRVPMYYRVPLINKVAAGYPRGFTDLDYPRQIADDYVTVPGIGDAHAFAARVVGDSMLPDYHEGDIVVFSPAARIVEGCDCFVRLLPDHETTFKRVFFQARGERKLALVRLQPLNNKYAPQIVEREQVAGMYRAICRTQMLV